MRALTCLAPDRVDSFATTIGRSREHVPPRLFRLACIGLAVLFGMLGPASEGTLGRLQLGSASTALAQAAPTGTITMTGSIDAAGNWPFVLPVSPSDTASGTYKESGSITAQWQITGAPTIGQQVTEPSATAVQSTFGVAMTCPCTEVSATYPAMLNVNYHAMNTTIVAHDDPGGFCGTWTTLDDVQVSVVNQPTTVIVRWVVGSSTMSPPIEAYGLAGDGSRASQTPARGTQTETETVTSAPCRGTGTSATYPGGDSLSNAAPILCPNQGSLTLACSDQASLLSPISGSATTTAGCTLGYQFFDTNSPGGACGGSPGGAWTTHTTWTLPGAYKIGFYASRVHTTTKFTWPDGSSQTIGKAPVGTNMLANLGGLTQTGRSLDDSGAVWDWALIYPVSAAQFQNGLRYAQDPTNFTVYNILYANCAQFLQGIARSANLVLPDFNDYTAPVIGTLVLTVINSVQHYTPSTAVPPSPDGPAMAAMLRDLYGSSNGVYHGGYVRPTDGSTIGHAPDPPGPIDPGSIGLLARAALADPSGTAAQYNLGYSTAGLTAADVPAGTPFSLTQTLSGDTTSMVLTVVDWGDGSTPDNYLLVSPSSRGDALIPHTYASPGTYRDKVVIVEDGSVAVFSGSVNVGAAGAPPLQMFSVPPPGPFVAYDVPSPSGGGSDQGANPSATPELDSLLLMGTGIVSLTGLVLRRRLGRS